MDLGTTGLTSSERHREIPIVVQCIFWYVAIRSNRNKTDSCVEWKFSAGKLSNCYYKTSKKSVLKYYIEGMVIGT